MFTRYAIDAFISDKISKVTECNVYDLYDEFPVARAWLPGYIATVVLVNKPRKDIRPFALQYIRRCDMAFSEYSRAREELQAFVSQNQGQWSLYFRALYHLEASLAQLYQAYDYSRKMMDAKLFDENDGSPIFRLNRIYNVSKHQVAEDDQPLWITNVGIESKDFKLDFNEIEHMLRSHARVCTTLTSA